MCHQTLCGDNLTKRMEIGEPRSRDENIMIGQRLRDMESRTTAKSTMDKLEKDTGVRFSILAELPYHDPIKNHVVEPMHNLLIGKILLLIHIYLLHSMHYFF